MHNVQNAMFAAAMAFSMGLKLEDIRHGLRTFDTTFFQAPGRMNIYDEHPFKVILDYGHNPAAVEAMCDLVERLEVERTADLRARRAGRPARRGHPRDRADRRRDGSTATSAGATTSSAAASPTRYRTCCARRCWSTASPAEQIAGDPRRAGRRWTPRSARPQPADLVLIFARRDHPELEAGHPVPPRSGAARPWTGPGASRPEPACWPRWRRCSRTAAGSS